jgi:ribosomal protein S12 methylthiotransferase
VLVDEPGIGRSVREAPEIDGMSTSGMMWPWGSSPTVEIVDALGPDLVAEGGAVPDGGRD